MGPEIATPATGAADRDRWIEALDRQAATVMAIFARAGFEPIAPEIIQPADLFLDLIGEELRARTYVFGDPDGAELCLRPDLTIPACRLYLARHGGAAVPARFSYNGPIFRYQPTAGDATRPREYRQAGIESLAAADPIEAEAEVVALIVEAVRAAGLRAYHLRLGDLGIFGALIEAIDMPGRWRARLTHHMRRPETFRRELARLTRPDDAAAGIPEALLERLDPRRPEAATDAVADHLEAHGFAISGTRTVADIAEHLVGLAADARATPLSEDAARLIETYLNIAAPAGAASGAVHRLAAAAGVDLGPALDAFDARLARITAEGIDLSGAEFSAGFGRAFEYYSGFVFEVHAPTLASALPVAGGGRYDGLTAAMGAGRAVAAVGAAIHSERLLLAVRGAGL